MLQNDWNVFCPPALNLHTKKMRDGDVESSVFVRKQYKRYMQTAVIFSASAI